MVLTPLLALFISGTDSEGKTAIVSSGQQEKYNVGTF